jgi:hypothetical protein
VRSLIKLKAVIVFGLRSGTASLSAESYKIFPVRIEYRSVKTKSSYIIAVCAGRREATVTFNFISKRTVYLQQN